MPIKVIYIARHGKLPDSLPEEEQIPSRTGIETDVPLSSDGISQSRDLAHYLLSLDTQPDLICTSPFYRCVETSKYISGLLDIPVVVDSGLSEWFPKDGTVVEPAPFEALDNLFPELLKKDWPGVGVAPASSGETEPELFQRCGRFLGQFLEAASRYNPEIETVLFVTHAPVKISLGLNLLGLKSCRDPIDRDLSSLKANVCSLDKYELEEIRSRNHDMFNKRYTTDDSRNAITRLHSKWIMTMNNNTEFLRGNEGRAWSFEDVSPEAGEAAAKLEGGKDDEETETVYVTVDFSNNRYRERIQIDKNAIFQYSGLDREQPLIRIGDNIYEGSWEKLLGTELAFPDVTSLHSKKRNVNSSKDGGQGNEEGGKDEDGEEEEEEEEMVGEMYSQGEQLSRNTRTDEEGGQAEGSYYSEKIYRITDRLVLSELQSM